MAFSRSRSRPSPPVFPVYNLTSSPLTATLYSEGLEHARLSSKIFNFICPKQLTQENYGIVESTEKTDSAVLKKMAAVHFTRFLSSLTRPITHKVIFWGGEIRPCNSNIAYPQEPAILGLKFIKLFCAFL